MFSLAIPTYNRSKFTIESFIDVLQNPLLNEVIIIDDHSNLIEFTTLWNTCNGLDKVKLYRNKINLKPLRNKATAIGRCKNEWCILLDSDNRIDNNYIETLSKLELKKDTFYSPQILYSFGREKELWNYQKYTKQIINKNNARKCVSEGLFSTLLNTGNYLVHRNEYLKVNQPNNDEQHLQTNDALYFSYKWLQAGNNIEIVEGLNYEHRIHAGSWYKNNAKTCAENTKVIERLIRQL